MSCLGVFRAHEVFSVYIVLKANTIWVRFEPKSNFRTQVSVVNLRWDVRLVGLCQVSGKRVYFARYDMSHLFRPRRAVRMGYPLASAGWFTSDGSLVVSYPSTLAAPQTVDIVVRTPRAL